MSGGSNGMRTGRWGRLARYAGAVAALASISITATGIGTAPPANASLLGGVTGLVTGTVGGVVGTTTGLVGGLLGVVTAGWDDGATTPPITLNQVASAIGADDLWARGHTGQGIGV